MIEVLKDKTIIESGSVQTITLNLGPVVIVVIVVQITYAMGMSLSANRVETWAAGTRRRSGSCQWTSNMTEDDKHLVALNNQK